MFLCVDCHKKDCDINHLFASWGICEDCRKTAVCFDCKIHHEEEGDKMIDKEICAFDNCNKLKGHDDMYGIEPQPGLTFAPYGSGDEGEIGTPVETDLICDCFNCDGKFIMRKFSNGGGRFNCLKCEQIHYFQNDKSSSRIILPSLYPSKMEKGSKIYKEFIEYKRSEWIWRQKALCLLGLITEEEREKELAECKIFDEALKEAECSKNLDKNLNRKKNSNNKSFLTRMWSILTS